MSEIRTAKVTALRLPDSDVGKLAYSPGETAAALGLSRWSVMEAIHRGDIRAVKLEGRWLVPVRELHRLLGDEQRQQELDEAYRAGWLACLAEVLARVEGLAEGPLARPVAVTP